MVENKKLIHRTSIRMNDEVKSIIERTFRDVCHKTGIKELSYGKVARAFWVSLAREPVLRKKCMELVCDFILEEQRKKEAHGHGKRNKSRF